MAPHILCLLLPLVEPGITKLYRALKHVKIALQSLHSLRCLGQENPSLDSSPGILVVGADTTLALTELALTALSLTEH